MQLRGCAGGERGSDRLRLGERAPPPGRGWSGPQHGVHRFDVPLRRAAAYRTTIARHRAEPGFDLRKEGVGRW